jgi:hypothetical protein
MRGAGLEQLAEDEAELVDGEVAAEGPVVDAAAQQRLDQPADLLFHGARRARHHDRQADHQVEQSQAWTWSIT